MTGAAHIAVVDDEEDIRDSIAVYLRRHEYFVSEADGAQSLDELMARRAVDLVVLDVAMPGEDGVSIARGLRRSGPIGIIMLTANTDLIDRIVGLEVGADDYMSKPFDLRELLARIRAVLRRAAVRHGQSSSMGREIHLGQCRLSLDSRKLFDRNGDEVHLTPLDFALLEKFAANPNRVLTREQLLIGTRGDSNDDTFDRAIDSRIARLRKKIESDPSRPELLQTVRGAGYLFVPVGSND